MFWAFLIVHTGKESTCNAGDPDLIPGSGRPPGGGIDNPLWYSCLENPMDRGAWRATVHGVTKSQQLTLSLHFPLTHFRCCSTYAAINLPSIGPSSMKKKSKETKQTALHKACHSLKSKAFLYTQRSLLGKLLTNASTPLSS